jgi:formylglycine-generating enzyme required for sulfatase activity
MQKKISESTVITTFILLFSLLALLTACTTVREPRKLTLTIEVQIPLDPPPPDPRKVALVIGNEDYQKGRLNNPTNDAKDIATALEQVGFEVIKVENASLKQMETTIKMFGQYLREGNVGVFYFAGHGMQYQGKNYLFPIGSMDSKTTLEDLVNIKDVLDTMTKANNKKNDVNIVFLDACRDNPFRGGFLKKYRNIGDNQIGLAMMPVSSGSLIAYSTKPNTQASDGVGRNSPYVKHLKQELLSGRKIEYMLTRVRVAVLEETDGRQAPGYYSELNRPFCFVEPCSIKPPDDDDSESENDKPPPPPKNVFSDSFLKDDGEGPQMVWIPSGTFKMGDIQKAGFSNELPIHEIFMNRFAIGRSEVTFAEYDRFVEDTGREKPDDEDWGRGNIPVINVSWHDATAYAEWLSQQTGETYRLPTESEWEYAARAGTKTQYWWGNKIGQKRAICDGCGSDLDDKQTALVNSFPANPFGLHDTVGNVWEWTCSEYKDQYTGEEQACNNNKDNDSYAIRGGSWFTIPKGVRSAYRFKRHPSERYNEIGFRLVRM